MMDQQKGRGIAVLTIVISVLALFSSCMGIFQQSLYEEVVKARTMPGSLIWSSRSQDMVSILIAIVLIGVAVRFLKKPGMKSFISMIGMSWYFFYAFGLYTIQGQYTSIYFIYMAIFSLSFYSMVGGALSLKKEEVEKYSIPDSLRKSIFLFLFSIIILLYPVWIIRILPDISNHVPSATFGVFVLDLCLIFPAIAIIAYMEWKRMPWGNVLAGIALVKVLTLCFSWFFAEISNPLGGEVLHYDMVLISGWLTLSAIILFVPYIRKIKKT